MLSARASGRLSWTSIDGAVHHFIAESCALAQRNAHALVQCASESSNALQLHILSQDLQKRT